MSNGRQDKGDWVEWVVHKAAAVGMNPVRVRWKLERLRRRWGRARANASARAGQIGYKHQLCPNCGAIVPGGEARCSRCGASMPSRVTQVVDRASGNVLSWLTAVRFIMGLCGVLYLWTVVTSEGGGFSPTPQDLIRWGANYPPATLTGGWWRLATHMLLHGDVIHIAFNLYALHIVGRPAQEAYGGRRLLLLFWLMGVAGGLVSLGNAVLMGGGGVAIGASGAITGLIGLMAVWGYRTPTSYGRMMRSQMMRWILYMAVFTVATRSGFLGMQIDHAAHIGGFVAGVLLGVIVSPQRLTPASRRWRIWSPLGWLGVLLVVLTAVAVPLTPTLDRLRGLSFAARAQVDTEAILREAAQVIDSACRLREMGDREGAAHEYCSFLRRRAPSAPPSDERCLAIVDQLPCAAPPSSSPPPEPPLAPPLKSPADPPTRGPSPTAPAAAQPPSNAPEVPPTAAPEPSPAPGAPTAPAPGAAEPQPSWPSGGMHL